MRQNVRGVGKGDLGFASLGTRIRPSLIYVAPLALRLRRDGAPGDGDRARG